MLARLTARLIGDRLGVRSLVQRVESDITRLQGVEQSARLNRGASPIYLRTDLAFGVRSGGSIGHIAGVVSQFARVGTGVAVFLTTDEVPGVDADIETHVVAPSDRFWDLREVPSLAYNETIVQAASKALAGRIPSFVYQRYSVNSYAGLKLARQHGVPFVLEYNGSEVWIGRNWGRPLPREALSERIELLNLRQADLVVVVSDAMHDELLGREVAAERILVDPNGVDPDRYRPDIDGTGVRARYDLGDRLIIGFIGTFGPWHGAEVLADAFGHLVATDASARDRVRLLMIGDGPTLAETRRRIESAGVAAETVFVGRTRQEDGPAHLAACDILVSPHVPNADGTRFFGSPTKLFEYMAMGRAIVASDLEQIGQVLVHDRTAWLVPPGQVRALADGMRLLAGDPVRRARLGAAARHEAVAHHTWREHTRRIIDALEARCA
jgi:glycosyltransferase involved in cell wall biosynthesis